MLNHINMMIRDFKNKTAYNHKQKKAASDIHAALCFYDVILSFIITYINPPILLLLHYQ